MPAKLTLERAKQEAEKYGFTVLSEEYSGIHDGLLVKCHKNGHITKKNLHNIRTRGCNKCRSETYEFIKEECDKFGFTLLSETYKNSLSEILVKCNKEGHISQKTWPSIKNGNGCRQCFLDSMVNIQMVKDAAGKLGFELLSEKYINSHSPLNLKCIKSGHLTEKPWNSIKSGCSCMECYLDNFPSYDNIFNFYLEKGCMLLEDEYNNCDTKMKYIAKCGHIWETTFWIFKDRDNYECNNCAGLAVSRDQAVVRLEKIGFKLLSEYKNSREPVTVECKKGHISQKTIHNLEDRPNCRKCWFESNKGENNSSYNPDREDQELRNTIRKRYGSLLRRALAKVGKPDEYNIVEMLGYTPDDLIVHLKSFGNWNEMKSQNWEIDHIFPLTAFFDYKIYDPKLINCLENLQPLSEKDNLIKGGKYTNTEFVNWLAKKGIVV